MRLSGGGWWIFLLSATVTCLFIIDLCSAIYSCGCRSLWAGATAHCNIHVPGVKHCPWCSIGNAGFAVVLGSVVLAQLVLSFRPKRWRWPFRLAASLLAFPVAGMLVALGTGWLTGYWMSAAVGAGFSPASVPGVALLTLPLGK